MSGSPDSNGDVVQFSWGAKRGVSKDKGVQFYGSFTFDGVEYSLYDNVLMFKDGIAVPFVGKIVKAWDTASGKKRRRVKIHWFFRPAEIASHIADANPASNELFLAVGDGVGVSNVNELEAIGGKCNVICTSKDEQNLQPSQKDLMLADYIFYRTFNVGTLKISEKIENAVQGVDSKFFFNRKEDLLGSIAKSEEIRVGEQSKAVTGESNASLPEVEDKRQSAQVKAPLDLSDQRPLKRIKLEANKQVKTESKGNADAEKPAAVTHRISNEKKKNRIDKDSSEVDKKDVGELKLDSRQSRPLDGSLKRSASKDSVEGEKPILENLKLDYKQVKQLDGSVKFMPDSINKVDKKAVSEVAEVSKRPETDRSKWFADLPWDTKMKNAFDQDRLVMLDNLDPEYSHSEIEDLFYQLFKQNCSVRLVEQSTFSNPHHGKALVIFKTSDAAEQAVDRLTKEILMLPNGRPLVASKGITRSPDQKSSAMIGLLSLEKYTKQRKLKEDLRKAAFASHYSQGNTIEFEMAIEWMLLQTKSESWWDELHEANRQEIKKIASHLKRK